MYRLTTLNLNINNVIKFHNVALFLREAYKNMAHLIETNACLICYFNFPGHFCAAHNLTIILNKRIFDIL